jgi:hypothetical protein
MNEGNSSHSRRAFAIVAISLSLLTVESCHDSPTAPPEPGVLSLRLATPNSDDRAMRIEVTGGAVTAAEAARGGTTLLDRPSSSGAMILLFGDVTSGEVVHLRVPDVREVGNYRASVIEVADAEHRLRKLMGAGYSAMLAQY